ncbi:MAG: helix-turn-helix transcriptional regulator [Nesterenkonia sp.]
MAQKKMTKEDLPRLMTRQEVADHLGVAEGTLRNWNSAGRGPTPIKYGTTAVRYFPEDVDDWLRKQRRHMLDAA